MQAIRSSPFRLSLRAVYSAQYCRRCSSQKSWLTRPDVATIPNMITVTRIAASPLLGYAVVNDMKLLALGGCVVFAFSDWLDGYLARVLNQQTKLGAALDPLADKFMIGSLTVGLVYVDMLPLPLAGLILTRDMILIGTSTYVAYKRNEFNSLPSDETLESSIAPSDISKINTGVQFALIGTTLAHFAFNLPSLAVIEPLWWITASTTLWSGLGYMDGSGLNRLRRSQSQKKKPLA